MNGMPDHGSPETSFSTPHDMRDRVVSEIAHCDDQEIDIAVPWIESTKRDRTAQVQACKAICEKLLYVGQESVSQAEYLMVSKKVDGHDFLEGARTVNRCSTRKIYCFWSCTECKPADRAHHDHLSSIFDGVEDREAS